MNREPSIHEEKKLSSIKPNHSDLGQELYFSLHAIDLFTLFLPVLASCGFISVNFLRFPCLEKISLLLVSGTIAFSLLLFVLSVFSVEMKETIKETPCYPDEIRLAQLVKTRIFLCGLPLCLLSIFGLFKNFETIGKFSLAILVYILGCLILHRLADQFCDGVFHNYILFLNDRKLETEDPCFGSDDIRNINEDLYASYEMYLRQHQLDKITDPLMTDADTSQPQDRNNFLEHLENKIPDNPSCENSEPADSQSLPNHFHSLTSNEPLNLQNSEQSDFEKSRDSLLKPNGSSSQTTKTVLEEDPTEENEIDWEAEELLDNQVNDDICQQQNWVIEQENRIRIEGWIIIFSQGEPAEHRTVHLSFCPPFEKTPEFHLEQISGDPVQLTATRVFPFGARFEIKRHYSEGAEPVRFCYFASAKVL